MIDVGALDLDRDLDRKLWQGHTADELFSVIHAAQSARGVPHTPASFREELQKRRFTNGADAVLVGDMYEEVFHAMMSEVNELDWSGSEWSFNVSTLLDAAQFAAPTLQVLKIGSQQLHGARARVRAARGRARA